MTAPTEPQVLPAVLQQTNPDARFTMDDVNAAREAARKEANDRLYPRLEQSDERYKTLLAEVENLKSIKQKADEAETARQAELDAAAKAAADAEKTALERLEESQREWAERFAQLQQDNEVKEALLQKERQIAELMAYRDQRIREEQDPKVDQTTGQPVSDGIAPQFIGYITGNSKEEIDAAIITAQQNTTSILVNIREAQAARAANAPGVSVAAGMAPQVTQSPGTREYTAAEIAAMPLDSPELQALRQQHGIGRATPQHGMFG